MTPVDFGTFLFHLLPKHKSHNSNPRSPSLTLVSTKNLGVTHVCTPRLVPGEAPWATPVALGDSRVRPRPLSTFRGNKRKDPCRRLLRVAKPRHTCRGTVTLVISGRRQLGTSRSLFLRRPPTLRTGDKEGTHNNEKGEHRGGGVGSHPTSPFLLRLVCSTLDRGPSSHPGNHPDLQCSPYTKSTSLPVRLYLFVLTRTSHVPVPTPTESTPLGRSQGSTVL